MRGVDDGRDNTSPAGTSPIGPPGAVVKKPQPGHRVRSAISTILVVFAVLFAIVTTLAFWSHELLLNTDKYVKTVAPILRDPAVTGATGGIVADATIKVTGLDRSGEGDAIDEAAIEELRTELARSTTDLLRSETAYSAWEKTLRYSHRQLVSLLRDRDDLLQFRGDNVQIDLVPFVAAGVRQVEKAVPGVVRGTGVLPRLDSNASPAEQRAQLAGYLGRTPTEDFGMVTVFKRSDIESAQWAVQLFDLLVWLLVAITAALVVAAVLVSPRRLRTLIYLGIGVIFAVIVSILAIGELRAVLAADATGQSGPIVIGAADRVIGSLRNAVIWLLVAGVAVATAAYLAVRLRRLGEPTERNGAGSGGWLRRYADLIRVVVGGATVVVIVFTPISLGGGLALVAVAAAAIIAVTVAGRRPPRADETDDGLAVSR